LNGVSERVELRAGSLREVGRRRFDLILANIHRTALLRGARGLSARLAAGGCAILSGFPTVDAALVETAWQSCDGRVVSHRTRGDWSALQWRRAGAP
jgi:ribosomal protein L11 methylase PrmA